MPTKSRNGTDHLVLLMNDECNCLLGVYEDHGNEATNLFKSEVFKTFRDDIEVGDIVVVESLDGQRHGYTTVKITELNHEFDFDSGKMIRWVVDKVNTETHTGLLAQEAVLIDAAKKAQTRAKKEKLRKELFSGNEDVLDGVALAAPVEPTEPAS